MYVFYQSIEIKVNFALVSETRQPCLTISFESGHDSLAEYSELLCRIQKRKLEQSDRQLI